MIFFWLLCALFIVIAFAFILPPLLQTTATANDATTSEGNVLVYRDQIDELDADLRNGIVSEEQYQLDRKEIEARLLEDVTPADTTRKVAPKQSPARTVIYSVALGFPIAAVLIYLQIGNQAAIKGVAVASPPSAQMSSESAQANEQKRVEGNVAALAKRLEQNPNDLNGWVMLGTSYRMLERYADASNAYAKATALKPDDADLLADYVFVLGMANGKSLLGQPTELIQRALKLDPENPKVLQLAGSAEFEAKNYKQALVYWEKLMKRTPPESELGQALAEQIAEAKRLSGQ
jgi:cytochrome c-type biogenesis protein CcmH